MRPAAALSWTGASLLLLAAPVGAVDRCGRLDLLPMSREQVAEAGAAGTGCSFLVDGTTIVFAAADDRAVVRLSGGIVSMHSDAGTSDLFPFTYDRWRNEKLSVAVRATGRAVRRGGESALRAAVLTVSSGGIVASRRGLLDCGS